MNRTDRLHDLVEELGGSVVSRHLDPGPCARPFAYLRDPSGNHVGVSTPAAA